jgi:hypothetical protein
MNRHIWTAFLLGLVSFGTSAAAQGCGSSVVVFDEWVGEELAANMLREQVYEIAYALRNEGPETLTYLQVALVGRNADGEIVEIDDSQVFYQRSLPQGLSSGETIRQRHGLRRSNVHEIVTVLQVTVADARCR